MQETKELTYFDGIIEGRLVENSFTPVGNKTFYHNDTKFVYVVTLDEKSNATLEVFKFTNHEEEVLVTDYIETLREEAEEVLLLSGRFEDILSVIKMHRALGAKR
ncbi:hypothetical protein [Brevibacillus sp. FSL L8-0710]|uniref:hypothetical protein n=1 Tax=Brevibacillus sp. FSL L8-0710 TaxID=2975313 RepID=UPI0030F9D5A1